MKILDEANKKILLKKLAGVSSETNKSVYEFTVLLSKELSPIDWKSSGGKMNFFEKLVEEPNIYIKDSGCLRQMETAGKFIIDNYIDNIDNLASIGYWTFHNIARSRLSQTDEINTQRKKKLVEDILSGELREGNVKVEINKIKDKEFPKVLEELLQWYNVWNFARLDRRFGIQYPGQIPGQIIINLIYHYLDKKAVIIDPMSGGGTTQDACSFLNNLPSNDQRDLFSEFINEEYELKCYSFDLNPQRDFISKKNTLNEDWGVKKADLVFLDPPYFSMMKDDYVENEFTKNRSSFYEAIDIILKKAHNSLKKGGLCALIIQPQTEKDLEDDEVCIDLPFECYKIMEKYFKPHQRIQVALSTQQFNATDVKKVQRFEKRDRLLGVARDLIIMKK